MSIKLLWMKTYNNKKRDTLSALIYKFVAKSMKQTLKIFSFFVFCLSPNWRENSRISYMEVKICGVCWNWPSYLKNLFLSEWKINYCKKSSLCKCTKTLFQFSVLWDFYSQTSVERSLGDSSGGKSIIFFKSEGFWAYQS